MTTKVCITPWSLAEVWHFPLVKEACRANSDNTTTGILNKDP